MSRIGKKPIELDSSVAVTVADRQVTVKGPKGTLNFDLPPGITVEESERTLVVSAADEKNDGAAQGMTRSILQGYVTGVVSGFRKDLEIQGIGYRGALKGQTLSLQLGFSHPIEFRAPEGVTLSMSDNTHVSVEGIDKQLVGQTAATIRGFRPPDSYKGKGVRYVGEQVSLKEGKTVG